MDHKDYVILAYKQQLAATQEQMANIMAAANVQIETLAAEVAALKAPPKVPGADVQEPSDKAPQ